ncbi:MAG: D-glycero-beta-D-manno-heptose 1,7-bisphosphate 7-phosphatase [Gammaproteobacteria bacterium]|nr:D-glycero-beta-D-manno-heptose 1,7-bisphosphate 7-phosphatase [Gammaproteobacteria bacterium]MCW5582531.1 D-glycero-beta-D-manno-heptose 1,7-bisphosphate 7-phosphatase [Gammaproteobacteria bacterium]
MPFIILDRDGVINYDSTEYIKSPEEWLPIPGSLEAIAQLNRCGFRVFIVTNQSGVARGYYDLGTLDLIHEKLMHELATVGGCIEEIFYCPHHPEKACLCRKPKPGLLHQIAAKYPINLRETFFIGDSLVDIQTAQSVGCMPLLVLTGNGEKVLKTHTELSNVPHFLDLAKAVEYVLSRQKEHSE